MATNPIWNVPTVRPVFATTAELVADTTLSLTVGFGKYYVESGDTVAVSNGYNGDQERFKIYAAASYTANGDTIRDLTGSGLQGVSLRRHFNTMAEFLADTRGYDHFAVDDLIIIADQAYAVVASGGSDYTEESAGGLQVYRSTPTRIYNALDYIARESGGVSEVRRVVDQNMFQDEDIVTAGLQAAIDAAAATNDDFLIYCPTGYYVLSDTLDFTSVNTDRAYGVIGDGPAHTVFIAHPNFGATKKMFDFDNGDIIDKSKLHIHGIRIMGATEYTGSGGGGDRETDPIGIYAPHVWTNSKFSEISFSNLGNTAIWIEDLQNSDFWDLDIVGCGYQPTEKDLGKILASGTNSSTTLTAYAGNGVDLAPGTFTGMVGALINIAPAGPSIDYTQYEIDTVPGDGSTCTLTSALTEDIDVADERRISYCIPQGAMTSSSATLTLNFDCLSASDIGRPVWVEGAGNSHNGYLQTTITNVSGTTITLADNAGATVSDANVYLGAAFVMARGQADRVADNGQSNDVTFDSVRIAAYHGVGLMMENAVGVLMEKGKFHSRQSYSNNFANSNRHMVICEGNYRYDGLLDRVYSPGAGAIEMVGNSTKLTLLARSGGYREDDYVVFMNTTGQRSRLILGMDVIDIDGLKHPVKFGSGATLKQMRAYGSSPAYFSDIAQDADSFVQMGAVHEGIAEHALTGDAGA